MSKQEFRMAQRAAPIGMAGIEACRVIIKEGYAKVNEVCVDSFSASAIVAVFDALNSANQAKLAAMPVAKAASVAFKLLK